MERLAVGDRRSIKGVFSSIQQDLCIVFHLIGFCSKNVENQIACLPALILVFSVQMSFVLRGGQLDVSNVLYMQVST